MTDRFPTLVILAGGSSSRLWPLREKSLLRFLDKPLIAHQMETYVKLGVRVIAVVCNPDNQEPIQDILSNSGQQVRERTFVQAEPKGMGDALLTLAPLLEQDWHPEALGLGTRVAYMWCPNGLSKSVLNKAVEKTLQDRLTTRTWSTVLKLHALAES